LTPFGGGLWAGTNDGKPKQSPEKEFRRQHELLPNAMEFAPNASVGPEISVEDIMAERLRIEEYLSRDASARSKDVKIYIAGGAGHQTLSSVPAASLPASCVAVERAFDFLLLAAQNAVTSVDATNVLVALSLLTINVQDNRSALLTEEMIDALSQMLQRVEEAFELLGSCRERSLAMAMGGTEQRAPSLHHVEEASDADSFSNRAVSLLVKLVFDCVSFSPRPDETLLLGDVATYWPMLLWAKKMATSHRARIQSVALKFLLAVQQLSPVVAVAFERIDVQRHLIGLVGAFVCNPPSSIEQLEMLPWTNVCCALRILQCQAVALQAESQECAAALTILVARSWLAATDAAVGSGARQCLNCESDAAEFECLGDR
jgi:hypothetical protein